MSTEKPIYVLDEFELHPGALGGFLSALEQEYLPVAEARGMQLRHKWITPPVELSDRGSTVLLVWVLDGVAGFWGMRGQSGHEDVAAWWERCSEFFSRRTRRFAAESSDLAAFAAAGRRNG